MGNRDFSPRIESRVYKHKELTDAQREAAGKIVAALKRLAEEPLPQAPARPGRADFLPFITPSRRNNVLLIDGPRGLGKTSLLIALLHRWSTAIEGAGADASKSVDWDDGTQEVCIVPFGIVDLHPLPEATVLLMHIVVRLGKVVQAIEETAGVRSDTPPWRNTAKGQPACHGPWRGLIAAIAAGWDPSGKRRLGTLDLADYTHEILDAELYRQDIHHLFSRFMDALVDDYQRAFGRDRRRGPLFVLGIDDADQIPHRAVELINVLRMLIHPRIAFVLTGDSELFERQMVSDQLAPLTRTWAQLQSLGCEGQYARSAADLARNLYDRTIPRHHRCVLGELPRQSRRSQILDNKQTIDQLLAGLRLREGALPLQDVLAAIPWLDEMFPGQLRALHDLYGALQNLLSADKSADLAVISQSCVTIFETALAATPLPTAVRDALHGHVSIHPTDGHLCVWFDGRIEVELTASSPRVTRDGQSGQLDFADQFEFSLFFREKENERVEIPAHLAAALCVALIVADLDERNDIVVDSGPALRSGTNWLAVQWIARSGESVDRRAPVHFGLLHDLSHVEYLLIALRWRVYAQWARVNVPDAPLELLVRMLLAACVACPPSLEGADLAASIPTLRAIFDHARDYLDRKNRSRSDAKLPRLARWIESSLPHFILPEYGLPTELAASVHEELVRVRLNTGLFDLPSARRRWIADDLTAASELRIGLAEADRLVSLLDHKLSREHPWKSFRSAVDELNEEVTPTQETEILLWERFAVLGYEPKRIPHVYRAIEKDGAVLRRLVQEVMLRLPVEADVDAPSAPVVACLLWQAGCAAQERPELADALFVEGDSLRFAEPLREAALIHESRTTLLPRDQLLELSVAIRAVHTAAATWEHKRLPGVLSALFHLFQRRFRGRGGPRWWFEHRVRGRVRGRKFVLPGPCPFVLGVHEDQIDRAWQQVVADLQALGPSLNGFSMSEEIALSLLDITRRALEGERFDVYMRPGGEDRLRTAVDGMRAFYDAHGAEHPMLREWLCAVITLAAPESGLPNRAAETLLALADRFERRDIVAARLDRLGFDSGDDSNKVANSIDGIINGARQHPWIRRFGIHTAH